MKNKLRFMIIFVMIAISSIIFFNGDVYAYTTGGNQFGSTNHITV